MFSNEIGIYSSYERLGFLDYGYWQQAGYRIKGTNATCNMTKAVSFENVRSDLKNVGKIGEFNPGQATFSEIQEVLKLAPEYLGLTQEQDKTKQKV